MMDPDYELFAAIVQAGSLSAAGREWNLSPAMVSKRLRRLEERLGVQLLHRSTRRMVLTSRGQCLYEDLLRILSALAQVEERVAAFSETPAGPLRVAAPTSFGRMHIAPYLAGFLDRYPQVELSLDLSDSFIDVVAERIDVAIRITDAPPEDLVAHRLATSERILCAAPAYLDRYGEPAALEDLPSHRLLAASSQLPWRLTTAQGDILIEGRSHVGTNSSELVRELTIAGAGIALRSLWDVNGALESGALRRILPHAQGSRDIAIFALHQPGTLRNPAVGSLIAFLKDLFDPMPPWQATAAD